MSDYVQIELVERDYLYVQTSQLKDAGNGLFSAIDIYKDEIISIFKGEILTEKQIAIRSKKGQTQYFISMLDGRIMDSKDVSCFAKYANDAKGGKGSKFGNNAFIGINELDEICIIANKKIKATEEIFCSYGKKYWLK